MKTCITSSIIALALLSQGCLKTGDSQIKSHSLDQLVSKTYQLSLSESVEIGANEDRKISLGELNAKPGSVLVYASADTLMKGDNLDGVKLTIIEPPYYEGQGYQHTLFTSKGDLKSQQTVELKESLLVGNNPGDEEVSGEWFLQINSGNDSSAKIESLTIKAHTRLD